MIDTIATEGQLNRVLGLKDTDELEHCLTYLQGAATSNNDSVNEDQASNVDMDSKTSTAVDSDDEKMYRELDNI